MIKNKKFFRYFLTVLQGLIIILWLLSGLGDDEGLNLQKLNILPIPNFGDILLFGIMALAIYGIQKLKAKLVNTAEELKNNV